MIDTEDEDEECRCDALCALYEIFNYMTCYDGFYDLPTEHVAPVIRESMAMLFSGRAYTYEIMGNLIIIAGWPRGCNDNGGHTSDRAEAFAAESLAMMDASPEEAEEL